MEKTEFKAVFKETTFHRQVRQHLGRTPEFHLKFMNVHWLQAPELGQCARLDLREEGERGGTVTLCGG